MDCSSVEAYDGAVSNYEQACRDLGRAMAFDNPSVHFVTNQILFIKECFQRVQDTYVDYLAYMEKIENER